MLNQPSQWGVPDEAQLVSPQIQVGASEVKLAHSRESIQETVASGDLYTGYSYRLLTSLCSEECLIALRFRLGAGLPLTASHFLD